MANIVHDLCGKLVAEESLVVHRTKCYVKGNAYGFTDPNTGKRMIVLDGNILPEPTVPAPQIVSPPEEESS